MQRMFRVGTAMAFGLAVVACGSDSGAGNGGLSPSLDSDGDGVADAAEGTGDADGDGVAAWLDPDENGALAGGGGTATTGGTAGQTNGDSTATNGSTAPNSGGSGGVFNNSTGSISQGDAGATDDGGGGGPVVGITEKKVLCGKDECTASGGFACCERWSASSFSAASCVPESQCETMQPPGQSEADIQSECDGPEDCGSGNVCCFILQHGPSDVNPFDEEKPGPGLGRECMRPSNCFSDDPAFTAGRPQGLISCHTDADCTAQQASWTCQPETASDKTAAGAAPRAHVSLCK